MTKLSDPLGKAFIDFFRSQGVKFVDSDTGKEITADGKEEDRQDED